MGFSKILLPILLFAGVSYGVRLIWQKIEEKKKTVRDLQHQTHTVAVDIQKAEKSDDESPAQFFFPRPELGLLPVGLKNLTNTCYLNSVLQCLTFTPPLAQFCLAQSHSAVCPFGLGSGCCPVCLLENHVFLSHTHLDNPNLPLVPGQIRDYVCASPRWDFERDCQADVHELLICYIDDCVEFLQQYQLEKSAPVFQQMFGGSLLRQIKCGSCGNKSNREEPFLDISVDIIHSSSLLKSIRAWFTPEVIDGYNCANRCKPSTAEQSCYIFEAPSILFIHLKRSDPFGLEKINKHITFEEYLDLSTFIRQRNSADTKPIYRLYGIIVHSGGSLHCGHYYAFIKDTEGLWYCCDDSFVSQCSLRKVLSEQAYILFYARANHSPSRIVKF